MLLYCHTVVKSFNSSTSSMIASQVLVNLQEFTEHLIPPSEWADGWHRGLVDFRNPYAGHAKKCRKYVSRARTNQSYLYITSVVPRPVASGAM